MTRESQGNDLFVQSKGLIVQSTDLVVQSTRHESRTQNFHRTPTVVWTLCGFGIE